MFDKLTDRLSAVFRKISGQANLTPSNIKEGLREIRRALLEADVAIEVVKTFLARVEQKVLGAEVKASLSPAQTLVKLVNEELVSLMGDANEGLNLKAKPAILLMCGLQGAGKTTTVAKLARHLLNTSKPSILVASLDVYRPAAQEQLLSLSQQLSIECMPPKNGDVLELAREAVKRAQREQFDVLILDTAGRTAIDDDMMHELKAISQLVSPQETLFVVDSMTGQDAARTAKAFHAAVPITGVILTKTDGDARGGAALSVRELTGAPIKFLGVGEKIEALEAFHPERIASRILGMGDVLTLVEELERKVDKDKAEKLAKKLKSGQGFDLADFREQLKQMMSLGGMQGVMSKLPGMGAIPEAAKSKMNDKTLVHMIAILDSMTPLEKRFPANLNGSRKRRIAEGSGTHVQLINQLLKQHLQMQKMMKKMNAKGGMMRMMRGLQGRMPPGQFPQA